MTRTRSFPVSGEPSQSSQSSQRASDQGFYLRASEESSYPNRSTLSGIGELRRASPHRFERILSDKPAGQSTSERIERVESFAQTQRGIEALTADARPRPRCRCDGLGFSTATCPAGCGPQRQRMSRAEIRRRADFRRALELPAPPDPKPLTLFDHEKETA
jgi:hypothetical protein